MALQPISLLPPVPSLHSLTAVKTSPVGSRDVLDITLAIELIRERGLLSNAGIGTTTPLGGELKSLLLLWQAVLSEEGTRCCTSTIRDSKRATDRFEHEGLSFLTITLPSLATDLQKGLEQEYISHDQFRSFAKFGSLPRFLGGFFDLVFDRTSGRLLDDPSIDAIRALRQLSLMFAKIGVDCTAARTDAAMDSFIENEQQVKDADTRRTSQQYEEFRRMSILLWADIFQKVDEDIYYGRILPKHGPGATADKLKGNSKYLQTEWPARLDQVFSHEDFLIPHWRYLNDIAGTELLEPDTERPVRVIAVPKTQKSPRIIAIEPTCMQYMQQGIMEVLTEAIERNHKRSWLIGFTDQVPNQLLAQQGSFHKDLATLDLSDASDRVSNQLVRCMLQNFPHLNGAVDATRSRKADVRGHGVIRLAKFASMGSALCFPIEALVFSTLIFLGIQKVLDRPLTREDVMSMRGKVRVYGDDIIVPVEYVRSVVESLETFGFKVSLGKSFWNGSFRESCGKDYYKGEDVSIVRVRQFIPTQLSSVKEIVSTVSLRNQLYYAGLWQAVRYLDPLLERVVKHYPIVGPESPILGRVSCLGIPPSYKMHSTLFKPIVKGWRVQTKLPKSNLEGYGALMKFFLKRGEKPFADRDHLTRYGRAESVNIKLGWASAA